jgi:hypothetical protein
MSESFNSNAEIMHLPGYMQRALQFRSFLEQIVAIQRQHIAYGAWVHVDTATDYITDFAEEAEQVEHRISDPEKSSVNSYLRKKFGNDAIERMLTGELNELDRRRQAAENAYLEGRAEIRFVWEFPAHVYGGFPLSNLTEEQADLAGAWTCPEDAWKTLKQKLEELRAVVISEEVKQPHQGAGINCIYKLIFTDTLEGESSQEV